MKNITLKEFLDMWILDNKTLLICEKMENESNDDIIDLLNDIYIGDENINELVNNNIICAIDRTLTTYQFKYFLTENIINSKVTFFAVIKKYFIIFIEQEKEQPGTDAVPGTAPKKIQSAFKCFI